MNGTAIMALASVMIAIALGGTAISMANVLNNQLASQGNQVFGFLNKASSVSQNFQNSSYNYNPSDLTNYSVPDVIQAPYLNATEFNATMYNATTP